MTTRALLLAGGLGTRLRPITLTVPKCLVPIGGRPILDYWIDALEKSSVSQALINTHHIPDPVREYIRSSNSSRQLQLVESFEPNLLGSAGTVHANRNWADDVDQIVVVYADNLSNINLRRLIEFHNAHDDPMTMALFHTQYPEKCGIAELNVDQLIVDFVEKPEYPKSNLANAGLYVLDRECWCEIADMNVFDFGFDVIPRFVGRMRGFVHDGYHRDIGTHEALAAANSDIKDWSL